VIDDGVLAAIDMPAMAAQVGKRSATCSCLTTTNPGSKWDPSPTDACELEDPLVSLPDCCERLFRQLSKSLENFL
jgi:hypothetical protein